jgi:adenine-specific DNA-methyltransferase
VIKYIGSKRLLVPHIVETVRALPDVRRVLDLFSGTSRVGHALKRAGYSVTANDHNDYAHVLARCYVQADRGRVRADVEKLLPELARAPSRSGWFTETYCVQSRYFQPDNGARIEGIREAIAAKSLDPDVEAVLLVALMEAADRVDSTCGLQMAYLKQWSPRSFNPLELRFPDVLDGAGEATGLDVFDAVAAGEWDAAYLDPPYNQHKYLNNYHVWETLIRWDAPDVYGTACKRVDCRAYDSPFNSKRRIRDAMQRLLSAVRARYLLVSFNDEGNLAQEDLVTMLAAVGDVTTAEHDYKRYVGAQIGIYNPSGEKVGRVSHLRNREFLYLVRTT